MTLLFWTAIEIPSKEPSYSRQLRWSLRKTKALWLRPWRFCKEKPFGFQWPEKPVRTLGSYDVKQNEKLNFEKMQGIFDVWNCRNLTIFGRCLIAKSLGIAQLVQTISNLNIPKTYIQSFNSDIFKFIWRKKKDKIKRKVMISDYDKGGLCALSIDAMTKYHWLLEGHSQLPTAQIWRTEFIVKV